MFYKIHYFIFENASNTLLVADVLKSFLHSASNIYPNPLTLTYPNPNAV